MVFWPVPLGDSIVSMQWNEKFLEMVDPEVRKAMKVAIDKMVAVDEPPTAPTTE